MSKATTRVLSFEQMYSLCCMYNLGKKTGEAWVTWPQYEMMDSSLHPQLHYWENMNQDEQKTAEAWLRLFKLIYDDQSIHISKNALYITGQFGHHFSTSIHIEHESWKSVCAISSNGTITHSLGSFWTWPNHLDFGGKIAHLEADPWIETPAFEGDFPTRLLKLITWCKDDDELWRYAYKVHLRDYKYTLWRILEFSNGIPEDYTADMSVPPAEFAAWTIGQLEKAKTISELEAMTSSSSLHHGGEE